MKAARFVAGWGFVLLAATFDSWFAWRHAATLPCWELNPVACHLAAYGIGAVLALKLGLAVPLGLSLHWRARRPALSWRLTRMACVCYLLLLLCYVLTL